MLLTLIQRDEISPALRLLFIITFFTGMAVILLSRFYYYFEQLYAERYKKPFFIRQKLFKNRLTKAQKCILKQQFSFYSLLKLKDQKYFEHRVATFIKSKNFVGRKEFEITDEVLVLISSTAVMLTFGFRDYLIELIENIIVYPSEFYSQLNDNFHKGEFNPQFKTLVFSWEDFLEGYDIVNDNVNLGIHEFAHAIHLNSLKGEGISATIFNDGYNELIAHLSNDKLLRDNLIKSEYFRDYAFTNQYEFVAVIIETFFESPNLLRQQFPVIYYKTRQMLNFNFAGY